MTVRVEPTQGPGRAVSPTRFAAALSTFGDWIVPQGEDLQSGRDTEINGPLNGFQYNGLGPTGLQASFDTGEGIVRGTYVAADNMDDPDLRADLEPSTTNQTVYLGYDIQATDRVIIAKANEFNQHDPKIPIYEFDTDSSSIVESRDIRPLGAPLSTEDGALKTEQNLNMSSNRVQEVSRLEMHDEAAYIQYDQNKSGSAFHIGRGTTTPDIALTFNGRDVGINRTSPNFPLDVGGAARFRNNAIFSGSSGNEFEITPSENEADGLSVRARNNPSTGDPIFTVESAGATTRFQVRQNDTVIMNNGLDVGGPVNGVDMDRVFLDTGGTITGGVTFSSSDGIELPNINGQDGINMQNGNILSQYNGWNTAYTYSGQGSNGFRIRNPDASGSADLFNVDATGDVSAKGTFEGLAQSPSEATIYVQATEPTNWTDGDIWIDTSS